MREPSSHILSAGIASDALGRDDRDFTWERTDKAEALREAAGISAAAV
jgi:S-adenosylmethionine synthetase